MEMTRIVGASPTINCDYKAREYHLKYPGDRPKGFQI
jgi:hypothetical protein